MPGPTAPSLTRLQSARDVLIEQMFHAVVRRVAWSTSPDGRGATLRLEIGDGLFAGATILITADPHELHIDLDAPPEIDLEAWKTRLRNRLASNGLTASFS